MTRVTLVAGGDAGAREAVIADWVLTEASHGRRVAAILEGFPAVPADFTPQAQIVRLAPGCPCCTGRLAMRVTLDRLLRRPPDAIIVGLALTEHAEAFRHWLAQPPYDALLTVADIRTL